MRESRLFKALADLPVNRLTLEMILPYKTPIKSNALLSVSFFPVSVILSTAE